MGRVTISSVSDSIVKIIGGDENWIIPLSFNFNVFFGKLKEQTILYCSSNVSLVGS